MKVAIIYNEDFSGIINRFGIQNKEVYRRKTINKITQCLEQGGHNVEIFDGNMHLIDNLQDFMPKVIDGEKMGMAFNLAYGIQGESRYTHLPAMLEMLGIPYVGSGPSGHALALDKVITKVILQRNQIPTPEFLVYSDKTDDMSAVVYPVIVKPKMEAVSFGLRVVDNETDLREAVGFIVQEFQQQALVEQFIRGREFCIGLLGNGANVESFPLLEIDLENDPDAIQSVEDKKQRPRAKICPALLEDHITRKMIQASKAAFNILGLLDFARVDLRMDEDGNFYILEINSMASLGATGSFVYAASVAGYDYCILINRMLDVAVVRYFAQSFSSEAIEKEQSNQPKRPAFGTRVRGFLRSQQQQTEKILADMVNMNTHVRNIEGVNNLGALMTRQLSQLGFHVQVIPQEEIGNVLLFSNTDGGATFDVLFMSKLDCSVPFRNQAPFRVFEHRAAGTAIWESKGGLVLLISALKALRFTRILRKLKVGILLTTDESLQGRYCKMHIEQVSRRARIVIGLAGGGQNSSIVTSRAGSAFYHCQMSLDETDKVDAAAMAVASFSQLVRDFAAQTDEAQGLIVAPSHVEIKSNIQNIKASGNISVSVRFRDRSRIRALEKKLHQQVKKLKKWPVRLQLEGGLRRPPLLRNEKSDDVWEKVSTLARQMDIRLLEEHRWSSSNLCFVDGSCPVVDGFGPVGGKDGENSEYILRHSLLERAALLASFLNSLRR